MTWFKVDDGFWSHPKTVGLSDGAVALWVRAGSYASQHLTDGHIPAAVLRMIGDRSAADDLVAAGLWDETPGGYMFHDWSEYQETSATVKERRAAARDRQRRSRAARDAKKTPTQHDSGELTPAVTDDVTADVTRDNTREFSTPDPTRPDLLVVTDVTTSVGTQSETPAAPATHTSTPSPKRKKPATRLPDDWQPSDNHREFCTQRGIDIDTEARKFRLHAEETDRRVVVWNSAFARWLENARPNRTTTPAGTSESGRLWQD